MTLILLTGAGFSRNWGGWLASEAFEYVLGCSDVGEDLNRPGLPEAVSFESRRHGGLLRHGIVAFLGFGWRDVADGLQQPAIVEPVHPLQRRELDSLE